MTTYTAPLRDMEFAINELADLQTISEMPVYEHATADLLGPILEEASRFASEVLAPTNVIGDQQACAVVNGVVTVPPELSKAYKLFVEGGWQGIDCPEEYGGMGLPHLIGSATSEMWQSANLALSLCPLLTGGAIEAIAAHGRDEMKHRYLPKMISGAWTGTMCLTEPQSGSDLATIRTQAARNGDHYTISGNKIFITWGDHEMSENVVHLVLARLTDAPEGIRGISLFLVPKFLVNDDGSLGDRNDVFVASVEHKMGIHASPTCALNFGENEGATGYLIGEENQGLLCMFTMMNLARLHVGIQGLAISERAYQAARDYSKERIQGQVVGSHEHARLIQHPDIRRMLMTMKSLIEAMRAVALVTAATIDIARHAEDADTRSGVTRRTGLLTPIVKGWLTEVAQELTSLGVQIHGGVGYVEETGAAQYLRDARILTIYEGTTGIQANDLVGRKVLADGGLAMRNLLDEIADLDPKLENCGDDLAGIRSAVNAGRQRLEEATDWLLNEGQDEPSIVYSAAFNYLMLAGTVVGAWQMGRAAEIAYRKRAANDGDVAFYDAKIVTARFYAEQILPRSVAYLDAATTDSRSTMDLPEDQF